MRSSWFTFSLIAALGLTGLTVDLSDWTGVVRAHAAPPGSSPIPEGLQLVQPQIPPELVGSLKTLNERLQKGLPPDENAVNILMVAFGPDAFEPELKADSFELLGLKALPPYSPQFVQLDHFTKHLEGVPAEQSFEKALDIQAELFAAGEEVWSEEKYPLLVKYLDANAETLKTVRLASEKKGYYAPLLSVESPPRLLSVALNIERRLPFLTRMLVARALLHFGRGEFDECTQDLVTGHKLALLLANGSPLDVSNAKAHVMDALIQRGESVILASGRFTGDDLKKFAAAFRALPPLPTAEKAADLGERAIVHQEIELLSTDESSVAGFFEQGSDPASKKPADLSGLDWDLALTQADEIWNQIVIALGKRDRAEQDKLFATLNKQYEDWEKSSETDLKTFEALLKADRAAASRSVGTDMAMSLRPLWWQRRATDDRARLRRDFTNVGIALLEYREKHGKFPSELKQLVPEFLPAVPADAHSDGDYLYKDAGDGQVLLMSLGPNRADDANQAYSDDQFLLVR